MQRSRNLSTFALGQLVENLRSYKFMEVPGRSAVVFDSRWDHQSPGNRESFLQRIIRPVSFLRNFSRRHADHPWQLHRRGAK